MLSPHITNLIILPEVRRLFEAFSGVDLYIVGGAVRDAILGKPIEDIDFATDVNPGVVIRVLTQHKIKYISPGIDHGTVTAIINGMPFQITSFREDTNPKGRHADVSFDATLESDAKRRDFTINAIYMDQNGSMLDPTGMGLDDIKNRIVRFIGRPEDRIKEDYLRILRFFRFNALFLPVSLDKDGLEACHKNVDGIGQLSKERVTVEMLKIFRFEKSHEILLNMAPELDMVFLNHDIKKIELLEQVAEAHSIDAAPIAKLAMITNDISSSKILLSKRQLELFKLLQKVTHKTLDDFGLDSLLYDRGVDISLQALLLAYASGKLDMDLRDAISYTQSWNHKEFPLSGEDIMKLGLKTGPKIGKVLDKTKAWWIENKFKPGKHDCLNYAKKVMDDE